MAASLTPPAELYRAELQCCHTSLNGSHTNSLLRVLEKQAQRSGRNSHHPISSYRPMPVVDNIDRHI